MENHLADISYLMRLHLKMMYVPGIFSSVFLLLYLSVTLIVFIPKQQYKISLIVVPDVHDKDREYSYCKWSVERYIRRMEEMEWRYKQQVTLYTLDRVLQRLRTKNDASTVLIVKYNEANTYGDFVQLVNFNLKHNVKRYAYVGDRMILFPF